MREGTEGREREKEVALSQGSSGKVVAAVERRGGGTETLGSERVGGRPGAGTSRREQQVEVPVRRDNSRWMSMWDKQGD